MLEFEVIPEVSLRNEQIEFILGMPLWQAIVSIQKLSRQIKGVELLYCSEEPLSRDVVINLASDGLKLLFDPHEQRLKVLEVYDLQKCSLRYCSRVFSSPSEQATVTKVEQSFGATHPGVYDSKQEVYILNWRGLSFSFPAESNVKPHYAHGLSSLQFPEHTSPKVSKMCVFQGSSLSDAKLPPIPVHCYKGNCYLDSATVIRSEGRTEGILLKILAEKVGGSRFPDIQVEKLEEHISFGDTTEVGVEMRIDTSKDSHSWEIVCKSRQILEHPLSKFSSKKEDVLRGLGSPSRVFYKSEDKMRIHRPSGDRLRTRDQVDYFFNYFTMGLDILFHAETHRVRKFVLHTNYPGHFDFPIYNRCNFALTLSKEAEFNDGSSKHGTLEDPPLTVTPSTKWKEISDLICDPEGANSSQPVVLNRTASNTSDNPFGATFCYGYQDVIIEVMANNHIASVTLFDDNLEETTAS